MATVWLHIMLLHVSISWMLSWGYTQRMGPPRNVVTSPCPSVCTRRQGALSSVSPCRQNGEGMSPPPTTTTTTAATTTAAPPPTQFPVRLIKPILHQPSGSEQRAQGSETFSVHLAIRPTQCPPLTDPRGDGVVKMTRSTGTLIHLHLTLYTQYRLLLPVISTVNRQDPIRILSVFLCRG